MLERLKTLSELYGVSGNEGRVRAYLRALAEPLADEVFIDPVGNLYAHKRGSGRRVMLAAHMDEVGMIVRGITDAGTLLYDAGGIDPRVVVSKRVAVGPNDIPGVIGAKAIHLQSPEERKRALKHTDLYVDIGEGSRGCGKARVEGRLYQLYDGLLNIRRWAREGQGARRPCWLRDRDRVVLTRL